MHGRQWQSWAIGQISQGSEEQKKHWACKRLNTTKIARLENGKGTREDRGSVSIKEVGWVACSWKGTCVQKRVEVWWV